MKKTILMAAATIMMICSCATKTMTGITPASIAGTWAITEAMSKDVKNAETAPFISFSEQGEVNGNASVNTFFGGYSVKNGKLKFSNLGMTRMMGRSMDVEDAISKALDLAETIQVNGNEAVMKDKSGNAVLKLKKQAK